MRRAWPVLVLALVVALAACGPRTGALPSASPSASASGQPLRMTSTALKPGEVGVAYAGGTLEATGGVEPYMFQHVEGTLPPGLTLSRAGVISGTPTTAGDFTFSVQVVDSGRQAVSADDSIDVVPALAVSLLRPGTIYVESGCDSACGRFGSQSGGQAPFAYSVTAGTLPAGTTLSGLSLAGRFASTGSYSFTVTVTDALGMTASVTAAFGVYAPLAFPPAPSGYDATCSGTITTGCDASVPYSGGYPGTTPRLTWYATALDGTRTPCVPPNYQGVCELGTPYLSGGAVHVPFPRETPRVPGPTGWNGVVVLILTDPVTGETTRAARVHVAVTFSY